MNVLRETNLFKSCIVLKGITCEIFENDIAFFSANNRKDLAFGISKLLDANPTFKVDCMNIADVEGKVQAIVTFTEVAFEGG